MVLLEVKLCDRSVHGQRFPEGLAALRRPGRRAVHGAAGLRWPFENWKDALLGKILNFVFENVLKHFVGIDCPFSNA